MTYTYYNADEIHCDDIVNNIEIGSGTYAIIKTARLKDIPCVNKIMETGNKQCIDEVVLCELNCMMSLRGTSNIVDFYGLYIKNSPSKFNLFIEEMDCDLLKWIDDNDINKRLKYIDVFVKNIVTACSHLYSRGIIHNDIKPSNILVKEKDNDICFKLTDFGMSGTPSLLRTTKTIGTWNYQPPECLVLDYYGKDITDIIDYNKIDIWAIGMTLITYVMGQPYVQFPEKCVIISYTLQYYSDNIETEKQIENFSAAVADQTIEGTISSKVIKHYGRAPEFYKKLIKQTTEYNIQKRISFPELFDLFNIEYHNPSYYTMFQDLTDDEANFIQSIAYTKCKNTNTKLYSLYIIYNLYKRGIKDINILQIGIYIANIMTGELIKPNDAIIKHNYSFNYNEKVYEILNLLNYQIIADVEMLNQKYAKTQYLLNSLPFKYYDNFDDKFYDSQPTIDISQAHFECFRQYADLTYTDSGLLLYFCILTVMTRYNGKLSEEKIQIIYEVCSAYFGYKYIRYNSKHWDIYERCNYNFTFTNHYYLLKAHGIKNNAIIKYMQNNIELCIGKKIHDYIQHCINNYQC